MRILYWSLTGVALLLLVVAYAAFTPSPPPDLDVSLDALLGFYLNGVIIAFVLGAVIAAVAGLLAPTLVRFDPRLTAAGYNGKVVGLGIVAKILAVALAVAVTIWIASRNASWPASESERVGLVVGSGRYLAIPAAAALGSALGFLLTTRLRQWAGRHALI